MAPSDSYINPVATMGTVGIGRDETLELRLKALRLPSFLEQYLELAERAAAEGWSHVRYLAELVTQERDDLVRVVYRGRVGVGPAWQ